MLLHPAVERGDGTDTHSITVTNNGTVKLSEELNQPKLAERGSTV